MTPLRRLLRLPRYTFASMRVLLSDRAGFLPLWREVRRSVRGWLRMPDAHFLYRTARHGPGSGAVVEIGSAWGRSTIFLAHGSKAAGRERVVAIDPHTGDDWFLAEERLERIDSRAEFERNLRRHDAADWVEPVTLTSSDAARQLPETPIRLLFIDGLHTYEGVATDIADWVPRVVPGGIVVFDDYMNPEPGVGVRRAVDELLASGLVEPKLHTVFNLTWVTRRAQS